TRVSNEVRTKVLDLGINWIDRAFVVNDWYISSYEPIVNFEGERVGMLYAGILETPFRNKMWNALWVLVLMFLVLMLLSIWLAIRGARSIIIPIEGMSKVVHANQRGEWLRVGQIEVNDEIGVLAREFDSMLDLLEHRKEELQEFADQLENKVASRTAELQRKNDELSRTISLLRETRQQLVAAEKLAALGELTAGVAHEINNPTSVILGNLDIIANEYSEASNPPKEEIALAIEQVYRIKGIIDSLLQYARPSEFGGYLAHVNINELVQDSLKLIQHLRKERSFDIVLDLNASETIEINAQECQQIIVNLIVNASHALPTENGLITIRTLNWEKQGVRL
ncbi:MAG: cache domain-containing protein, partial [Methylococcales bacterium]|nr:cache domain-containing protein [Methylococcales bacterium]